MTSSMVCNRSQQLLGNPMLARLIKEGGSVDMSVDNMHHNIPRSSLDLKTALSLLFLLSPKINVLLLCINGDKGPFFERHYGNKWSLYADVTLCPHSPIHSLHVYIHTYIHTDIQLHTYIHNEKRINPNVSNLSLVKWGKWYKWGKCNVEIHVMMT